MNAILLLILCQGGPPLEKLVYAAGYIPNVQFAPFYLAADRGYYREEGLEVSFDYTMGPDVLKLTALDEMQIASADPDAFLEAAARGLPLVHVATLYQRYPLALISRQPIRSKADLQGKRVGISGTYGSSYLALKAMLAELGMTLADIRLVSIGYTQVAALQQDKVDAVVGYANNEPLRLESLGVKVHVRTLKGEEQMPGVGLMASARFFKEKPKLLAGFLRASFRGLADLLANPRQAYAELVARRLPELKSPDRYESEFRVLEASIPFWQSDWVKAHGFGQCDPRQWLFLVKQLEVSSSTSFSDWKKWVNFDFQFRMKQP